jgi:hypothetical protein
VNANFTVALSALDNVALDRLQWNFNNTTWTDVTGATGLPGTSYGPLPFIADISGLTNNSSHTIYFRGKDDVGNYGAAISWTFYKDATAPSAATNFDADPRHGGCQLDWTAATGHAGYTLYWKKRAGYPYPTGSMSLAWNGDTLTADGLTALAAGVTSYPFPTPIGYGDRGVYDFVLVAKDCVNTPAASAMASATNYFLGDVAGTPTYDGRINMPDLLVMGTHYGTSPTTDPAREMNIGPTHNGSCYGLPNGGTTRINFEDLIIFAMNYGESGPELPNTVATSTTPVVELRRDGESWQLVLTGQLKGFSARIETEAVLQEATADFPVFFYREGNAWLVDAVSLSGMLVDGSSVTLRFTGDNAVTLASVDGRDANNNVRPVEALSEVVDLPTQFALEQNYPNPFNPTTTIRYALPEAASVKLAVYNALGQEVAVLVQGSQTAGFHEARLDGSGLASGVYVYRLEAGRYTDQKKLVLVK